MIHLNAEQRAAEGAIRAQAFASEVSFIGMAVNEALGTENNPMHESRMLREIEYRKPLVGNAAPVLPETWRRIDDRAASIQRDVLVVFNRLAASNTTPVSMGDIMSYYPQISDSGEVQVSMDGRNSPRGDQAIVKYVGTPVPVLRADAPFGWREMEVIRKGGRLIEAETIANHQRRIAEKAEDMVLNGEASVNVAGNTIYGLRNHPLRSTGVHGLTLNGATGAQWLTAFQQIINLLIGDNAYSRATIFLNYSDWVYASINEFAAGYPKTILQRLTEIAQIAEIVPASRVPANNLLAVAGLDSGNWGSILSGMGMTTRPKVRQNPEDEYVYTVMMAAAPQLRTDFDGRAPFAHTTQA